MTDWAMKKDDLLPIFDVTLRDGHDAVDLSSATSATFKMASITDFESGAVPKISAAAVIDADQVNNKGRVTYTWASGDTDTTDEYYVEIEVLYSAKTVTYPNGGYYRLDVLDNLDSGT